MSLLLLPGYHHFLPCSGVNLLFLPRMNSDFYCPGILILFPFFILSFYFYYSCHLSLLYFCYCFFLSFCYTSSFPRFPLFPPPLPPSLSSCTSVAVPSSCILLLPLNDVQSLLIILVFLITKFICFDLLFLEASSSNFSLSFSYFTSPFSPDFHFASLPYIHLVFRFSPFLLCSCVTMVFHNLIVASFLRFPLGYVIGCVRGREDSVKKACVGGSA